MLLTVLSALALFIGACTTETKPENVKPINTTPSPATSPSVAPTASPAISPAVSPKADDTKKEGEKKDDDKKSGDTDKDDDNKNVKPANTK